MTHPPRVVGEACGDARPPIGQLGIDSRWLVACFVAFTAYAGAVVFSGGNDGTWATWAVGGYAAAAAAAVLAWRSRRPAAVSLSIALGLALVGPTVWLILNAPATPDVAVVTQGAKLLVHTGSPYLPTAQLKNVLSYNPYLPAMTIFGLPRAAGIRGLLGDTRPWLVVMTFLVLVASFWLADSRRQPGERSSTWRAVFALGTPILALPLAVGITDGPIIALVCLALGLLVRAERLTVAAAIAIGAACAMKFTAWPALPVLAAMVWARQGVTAAVRFVAAAAGTAVALVVAFAPGLFRHPGELIPNVVLFPLGLTHHKTPAASPLPGHLLASAGSAGHAAAVGLLIAAGVGVVISLVLQPPADVRAAAVRLSIGLVLLFTLAPASRFGYYDYPLALLGWLALASPSRAEQTVPAVAVDA